jgi:hypothetical protein
MKQPQRRSRKRVSPASLGMAVGAYRIVIIRDGEFVSTSCIKGTCRWRKTTPCIG